MFQVKLYMSEAAKGTFHLSNGTFILCLILYLDTFLRPPIFFDLRFSGTKCVKCSPPII